MFPTITVIVPIYNSELTLVRCLDSILAQSFRDFEILLVDDGSKDDSGIICDEYSQKDNRIKVFHKENAGVSSARNLGLHHSVGKWVTFVDSDDYIEEDYLQEMISLPDADIKLCSFNGDGEESIIPISSAKIKSVFQQMFTDNFLWIVWGKLFKNDIIRKHKLNFDENLRLSEDTIFCMNYAICSETISASDKQLYNYSGVWAGGSKYKLSLEETVYLMKSFWTTLHQLCITFGVRSNIGLILMFDKLKLLYNDRDYASACSIMKYGHKVYDRKLDDFSSICKRKKVLLCLMLCGMYRLAFFLMKFL